MQETLPPKKGGMRPRQLCGKHKAIRRLYIHPADRFFCPYTKRRRDPRPGTQRRQSAGQFSSYTIQNYSMRPLSFSKNSISVPLTFLRAILSTSFSAKESGASLIGFLSMA